MKYIKIESIKKQETEDIYHISIEKNHNFFGNDILLHNCDFYNNSGNNGNIGVFLYNYGETTVSIKKGEAFCQGIFLPYFKINDDKPIKETRVGGFGSTNQKESNQELINLDI